MTSEPQRSYGGTPKQRRPLAEIVQQLLDRIELAGGEVDDGVDALGLELSDKTEAYIAVIRLELADADKNASMAAFFRERAYAATCRAERLQERLDAGLRAAGVDKVKAPTCSVWFQESKSVEIKDEKAFVELHGPTSAFVRVNYSASKSEAREAIEAGHEVAGAKLVTTKHLRWK